MRTRCAMSHPSIARHLRDRARIARILEAEADDPEPKWAMRRPAVHYEIWADKLDSGDSAVTVAEAAVSPDASS